MITNQTIHILRDGQTVGMLSVNGYTRQVFVHTWHGDLVERTHTLSNIITCMSGEDGKENAK